MSFSATEAAFEGFRVVRRHPTTALFWGLAYLVLFLATFGLGGGQWANVMAAAVAIEGAAEPSPDDLMSLMQAYASLFVWLMPLSLVIGAVLSTAVARSVLRPDESRWGYLRFSLDEARVLVVTLAVGLITGLLSGVMFGVAGGLFAVGLASNQGVMFLLGLIVVFAALALIVWLSVKFSLAVPMTVDRRKISVLESFKATKGHFWPLLGMAIIALMMSLIVSLLGAVISAGTDLTTGGITGLGAMEGLSTLDVLARGWPAILVWSIVNAFLSALQLAVLYAPFSAAWADLRNR